MRKIIYYTWIGISVVPIVFVIIVINKISEKYKIKKIEITKQNETK